MGKAVSPCSECVTTFFLLGHFGVGDSIDDFFSFFPLGPGWRTHITGFERKVAVRSRANPHLQGNATTVLASNLNQAIITHGTSILPIMIKWSVYLLRLPEVLVYFRQVINHQYPKRINPLCQMENEFAFPSL